jgi:hypothetical protein
MHLDPDKDYCQCDYCKNYYFPDQNEEGVRVFGEGASLNGPLCAVLLLHATMGGTRFLYCGQCRGMPISMEIFVALTEELRGQLGPAAGNPHAARPERPGPPHFLPAVS